MGGINATRHTRVYAGQVLSIATSTQHTSIITLALRIWSAGGGEGANIIVEQLFSNKKH